MRLFPTVFPFFSPNPMIPWPKILTEAVHTMHLPSTMVFSQRRSAIDRRVQSWSSCRHHRSNLVSWTSLACDGSISSAAQNARQANCRLRSAPNPFFLRFACDRSRLGEPGRQRQGSSLATLQVGHAIALAWISGLVLGIVVLMSRGLFGFAEPGPALPTYKTAARVLERQKGSGTALIGWTVLRTILIAPPMMLFGVSAKQAFAGAALSSILISTFTLLRIFNAEKTGLGQQKCLTGARRIVSKTSARRR